MSAGRGQVVIVSAKVGAGHTGSTDELARRLRTHGFGVRCLDFMDLLPGPTGRTSLRLYNNILRYAPWVYAILFGIGNQPATAALTRLLLVPARRRLLAQVDADVRAVVSTYSLASQVIGPLRQRGTLRIPAITYATDFAVHRHWVAPGMDAHLSPHAVGADRARRLGGRGALAAGALVSPRFQAADAEGQRRARAAFGLPDGRLALIAAGSWGVGRVAATAQEVAASGVAIPIVVCGRNSDLRRQLHRAGVPHALGWVDDMPALMQAADVLIENAGGLMALEGMACGLPVATYRPIPGHGELSAAALSRAGISAWIQRPSALGPVLAELLDGERGRQQRARSAELFRTDAALRVVQLAGSEPSPPIVAPAVPVPRGMAVAVGLAVVLAVVGVVDYLVRRGARARS